MCVRAMSVKVILADERLVRFSVVATKEEAI